MLAVVDAAAVIRRARRDAGLTQAELAQRLGTTQSAIARLEREGSNPTVATLEAVMAATGARLTVTTNPFARDVDETMLRDSLRMTPAQRLAASEGFRRSVDSMAAAARRAGRA